MHRHKGKIRFSRHEVWNLDLYLAEIIYTGLIQFKQAKRHGVPSHFLAEATHEQLLGIVTPESIQCWEDALDQMIYAFSPLQDYEDIETCNYTLKMMAQTDRIDPSANTISARMLKIPHEGVNEKDMEAYEARKLAWEQRDTEKRLQGRELFAQYFNYLWD